PYFHANTGVAQAGFHRERDPLSRFFKPSVKLNGRGLDNFFGVGTGLNQSGAAAAVDDAFGGAAHVDVYSVEPKLGDNRDAGPEGLRFVSAYLGAPGPLHT